MLEITAIDHIVLRTSKLQQMLEFYCNVLGCTVERETSPENGLVQLRAGSALIDLVTVKSKLGKLGGEAPSATGNNMDHFCLQLKPISDAAIKLHLANFGITEGDFEQRYGAQGFGNSIYIKDPQGNTVELRSMI
ncbi:VOC family protein [Planctobacterium marinum]|uniref:Lactoylglutathione lyase n=1 Tax=Planctobacterium marinum TaxID=1631968 RepID=A0AA48KQD0_9ALTE|nr:lactoylglutathione lyase [Planctobacterium marinum]